MRECSPELSSGGRRNSGEAAVVGGDDLFGCFPPAGHPFTGGNAHRKTDCAREINSCEGMFAGRECVAGGGTPPKPLWSEVMIFLGIFLRQRRSSPEERVSAMKQAPYYEHILSFQTIIDLVR